MRKLIAIFFYSVILFLIIPMFIIVWMSFSDDQYYIIKDMRYSLRWYKELLNSSKWIVAISNSIQIGFISTAFALIIGIPGAIGLHKQFAGRNFLLSLVLLPVIIPPLISAVSWYFALSNIGWYNSKTNIILGHFLLGVPFVVISVLASLTHWSEQYYYAGKICGASPLQIFYYIQYPIILPGILIGGLLCFMNSFDELLVALFLSDYSTRTVPLEMWSGLRENISPTILAVTVLTMLVSLVVITITTYVGQNKYKVIDHYRKRNKLKEFTN